MSTSSESPTFSLASVVDALCGENEALVSGRRRRLGRQVLPSREALAGIVADLRAALFPGHFGGTDLSDEGMRYFIGATLDGALHALHDQIRRGLWTTCAEEPDHCTRCDELAMARTSTFAAQLPRIRALLASDVKAAYEGDPAASSPDETLFCYPGITAVTYHRLAHELHVLGVPLIPRILAELAHVATGIDIHPGAQISGQFFIDHGTGVVIGETSIIGERVRIYQGVTLGARSFPLDESGRPVKGVPRHPIVGDDVVIYAGATILGRVTIGRGSIIGGNVWLTRDLPPGSRVTQAQARPDLFDAGSGI